MSKLARVLDELEWSDQTLATLAKVCRPTITRGRLGQRNFSLEDALAIEQALSGRLRAEDLPLKEKSKRALERLRARGSRQAAGSAA